MLGSTKLRGKMEQRKLQVFVSSTFDDMKAERQAAVQAVLEAGHIPAGMELFSAGDDEQFKIIENWIDESDVYMLILGGRYGSIEPTSQKSYIECEYRYALEKGKRVFSLVMSDELLSQKVKISGLSVIERNSTEKYNEFKKLVLSKLCGFFSTLPELEKETLKSLSEISKDKSLLGWIRPNKNTVLKIGEIKQYFYPFLDPMKFKAGRAVKSLKKDNTWNSHVLREKFSNTASIRWIYGPYRTLPCIGRYTATFRLRLDNKEQLRSARDRDVIVIDVYDYYGGQHVYVSKLIKLSELENAYKDFDVDFEYIDISKSLEYRVGVLATKEELVISCDAIKIKREANSDL